MTCHVEAKALLYCCLMALLLQGVTGGSRLSLTTPETLRGVHHLHHSGDTSGDDSNSGFLGRYDLEYPDDGLHDLTEVVEKRRYFLSDYQLDDFSLREAQQTFYKEYMKRPSLPEAEVLPPRNREEREGVDVSRSTTGISKHNESWVSKSATGAELKEVTSSPVRLKTAPSDPFSVEVPAAEGKDEAEDAPARVGDGGATRLIRSAEDLQQAGRPLCRSRENYLPPDLFSADACALCYHYLQNKDFFHTKWNQTDLLKTFSEGGRDYAFRITVLFNPYNESQVEKAVTSSEELKATFRGEVGHGKWISCCQAAEECCRHMLTAPSPPGNCPNTWDGWQCWPATPPNTQLRRSCPSYIYHGKGPSCAKEASKLCESEGRWYRRGEIHEWSNYSSCSVEENIHRRLYVHIAAYSISVASLFPALCIFFSYKQLRVHRITLHKHLFISLLLEAVGVIVFRFLQLYKNDLIQQNPAWCVALNLLTKYASLSNYMWYLCEGFYLHKLLASAFAEQNSLIIFYLIGWGFPLVPLTIYAVIRGQGEGNTHCWIVPVEGLDWVINLPPLLAILINVIFVVNIIRILVSKVRATSANEPSQYRKAVRATMMVVPLFGLQYIITIYRHQVLGCDWQDLYQIFNNLIEGSTGAVVAIIFCYTNGEVKALLRRSWERLQERRAPHGVRGHEALRSRSLSTVQTTLIDPSPARRNSSIVSICANNNPFRRSNSGANASQMLSLRGSRTSITQASQADSGSAPPAAVSRRSPKTIGSKLGPGGAERFGPSRSPVHILDSSPASRSPSLLEEVEDEVKCAEAGDPTLPAGGRRAGVERHCPVVLFKKNDVEPCVNINVNGLRTSVDQGYESCHNTGVLDE